MSKTILIVIVVLIAAAIIGGAYWVGDWQSKKAEREQQAIAQQQAAYDHLPDWAKTAIIAIGTLVGVDIIGKQLLIAVIAVMQIIAFTVVMIIFSPLVAFARNGKYVFYMAIVAAAGFSIPVALLAASLPGGKSMLTIEAVLVVVLALVGMGGGFEFMYPLFEVDGALQNGNGTVKARLGGGAIRIVGRGRTYDDGKWQ